MGKLPHQRRLTPKGIKGDPMGVRGGVHFMEWDIKGRMGLLAWELALTPLAQTVSKVVVRHGRT